MYILSDRLDDLRRRFTRKHPAPRRDRVERLRRLSLETLEGRELLTTITVTTVADTIGGAAVSLRDAIVAANSNAAVGAAPAGQATPVVDEIDFDIPGIPSGQAAVINLASALPAITERVFINGLSQPGSNTQDASYFLAVQLVGSGAGAGADGLDLVNHTGSQVRGLNIYGFSGNGIALKGGGGHFIDQNVIGMNSITRTAVPNGGDGIEIAADSASNIIGAQLEDTPGESFGNIIGGNTGNGVEADGNSNSILSNLIGTDQTAVNAVGNGASGVLLNGSFNLVIGPVGQGNQLQVISANALDGIRIAGSNNTVRTNLIGTDVTGNVALPNRGNGITILVGASANTVGSVSGFQGNQISGNAGNGIQVDGNSNTVLGNFIGTDFDGGAALGNGANGVVLNGNNNNLYGVYTSLGDEQVISGNGASGVLILGNQNTVRTNQIGLDRSGQLALPNLSNGVTVASGASGNVIGSIAERLGNNISGNLGNGVAVAGIGTFVQGNFIGTNGAGTAAVGNGQNGILITGNLTRVFGTFAPGGTSIISGNKGDGVRVASGFGNLMTANLIGLNGAGTAAVPNGGNGLTVLAGATGNTSGAIAGHLPDIIAGNLGNGIEFDGDGNFALSNYIGTNEAGTVAIPNGGDGILLKGNNNGVMGNLATADKQVIAGNRGDGVRVVGNGNTIQGNVFGLGADEKTSIPNGGQGLDLAGGILTRISLNRGISGLTATTSAYQIFVNEVYLVLLGRPADPGGLNGLTAFLMKGGSRVKVVQMVENSGEYRNLVVQQASQRYLGHAADAAGLKKYATALVKGGTETALAAALLGTGEFLHGKSMGTKAGFINALYQAVLSRAPSAKEQAAIAAKLAINKSASRTAAATTLLTSTAARTVEVNSLFTQALNRQPSASELSLFSGQLARKKTDASVLAQLIGSDEFLFGQ